MKIIGKNMYTYILKPIKILSGQELVHNFFSNNVYHNYTKELIRP